MLQRSNTDGACATAKDCNSCTSDDECGEVWGLCYDPISGEFLAATDGGGLPCLPSLPNEAQCGSSMQCKQTSACAYTFPSGSASSTEDNMCLIGPLKDSKYRQALQNQASPCNVSISPFMELLEPTCTEARDGTKRCTGGDECNEDGDCTDRYACTNGLCDDREMFCTSSKTYFEQNCPYKKAVAEQASCPANTTYKITFCPDPSDESIPYGEACALQDSGDVVCTS